MATQADVRRIALAMPETEEGVGHFAFSVRNKGKLKGFVWVWMERVDPKKGRIANPGVIAARTTNVAHRDVMIAAEPRKYFTEPHYAGFPAVLVRLAEVTVADLRPLIADAWRCLAPKELLDAHATTASARARSATKKAVTAARKAAVTKKGDERRG
jgi:hypothetical protein